LVLIENQENSSEHRDESFNFGIPEGIGAIRTEQLLAEHRLPWNQLIDFQPRISEGKIPPIKRI